MYAGTTGVFELPIRNPRDRKDADPPPVVTHWIPSARRARRKLDPAERRLGALQASKARIMGAQAARDIKPLWVKHVVQPAISRALESRQDAYDDFDDEDLDPIYAWFEAHSLQVASAQERLQKSAGLSVKPSQTSARVQTALVKSRQDARKLIKSASNDLATDLKVVLDNPAMIGARVETIRDALLERGNVSNSRAELIARDQTYKLNAAVTRAHHEDAGITSYTWSTSLDERVRPEHEELEGQVFEYSNPPDEGNPGDPVNCRCVAIGITSEDQADADDDED
jgi:SPP1 gp7 family putative phage head morphogenesis protein